MLIEAPAIGGAAEAVDDGLCGHERSLSGVAANEDVILTKSYDVWTAITRAVTEEAGVAIEAPNSSVEAEVREHSVGEDP